MVDGVARVVYLIVNSRVHPLDLPVVSVMQYISKWGGGSDKLVAALDRANLSSSESTNKQLQN
jgi:hypothetical protein